MVCDEIEELLPSCDFYSLDVEMTSLEEGSDYFNLLDSTEERCDVCYFVYLLLCRCFVACMHLTSQDSMFFMCSYLLGWLRIWA